MCYIWSVIISDTRQSLDYRNLHEYKETNIILNLIKFSCLAVQERSVSAKLADFAYLFRNTARCGGIPCPFDQLKSEMLSPWRTSKVYVFWSILLQCWKIMVPHGGFEVRSFYMSNFLLILSKSSSTFKMLGLSISI